MGLQVQHVLSYTSLHSFPLHRFFIFEPVLFCLHSVFHLCLSHLLAAVGQDNQLFHFVLIFCSWRRGDSWWWTDGGRRRRKREIGNRLSPGEGAGLPGPTGSRRFVGCDYAVDPSIGIGKGAAICPPKNPQNR